jgi:hypothetical protein
MQGSHRAEYDRFGGVGISMARQSKSPARLLLPEHPIQALLLRANDLGFGASGRPQCRARHHRRRLAPMTAYPQKNHLRRTARIPCPRRAGLLPRPPLQPPHRAQRRPLAPSCAAVRHRTGLRPHVLRQAWRGSAAEVFAGAHGYRLVPRPSGFIAPCLPSKAARPPSGPALGSRNQA